MTCVGIKGDDELSDFILDFQAKIQNFSVRAGFSVGDFTLFDTRYLLFFVKQHVKF